MTMFCERIRELRENKNLTQTQAAEQIGITQKKLSNIETGKTEPSMKDLKAICEFYNVSADYLLAISDDPEIILQEEDDVMEDKLETKFKETKYKKRDRYPTSINLDNDLMEKIRKDAKDSERSISAQITYIIKKYYQFIEK